MTKLYDTNLGGAPLACFEPGNDLARNGLDLLHLISVRNENKLLRSYREVRLELLDAFVNRSHDGAVLCRFAPGREIPLFRQPFHHLWFNRLLRLPDTDRQLRCVKQLVRVFPGFTRKVADLAPRLREALRP